MASRHSTASDPFASLRKRQNGCVLCDTGTPKCPDCKSNESCQFTVPLSCKECPRAYCAAISESNNSSSSSPSNNGPNAGAIAGAVIGGLAVIGITTYLVWKFCIKNKRHTMYDSPTPAPVWNKDLEPIEEEEGQEKDFAEQRSKRASTHTVHSIASTVLTRASNIIQIAYIPGVTNRATPTSPTVLVPPVPPIPLTLTDAGTPSSYEDQHFFVPGDLRNSTYSGISNFSDRSDRTSYATRTSYAPRSSVASTIYGKNAIVSPMPAQKGTLLKPSLVSVKSRGASHGSTTPPVPSVDYEKYEQPLPSPAFSIGATFFKNARASTATAVRPQVVRVGSSQKKADSAASSASGGSPSPSLSELSAVGAPGDVLDTPTLISIGRSIPSKKEAPRDSAAVTTTTGDTLVVDQGPFSDPPNHGHKNNSLGNMIEEASRRAAQQSQRGSGGTNRGQSPFGDEHAVRD